uniref:Fact complex subunit ssrp1 n=1 Tax=Triatoma infestans TaxID=30076 RepID=A0A161M1U0_TRIIF
MIPTLIFKNNKTGKVEQLASTDLELCNWQKLVGTWGLSTFFRKMDHFVDLQGSKSRI